MEQFLHDQNVQTFRKQLAESTTGEVERKMLLRLLAEEEARDPKARRGMIRRII